MFWIKVCLQDNVAEKLLREIKVSPTLLFPALPCHSCFPFCDSVFLSVNEGAHPQSKREPEIVLDYFLRLQNRVAGHSGRSSVVL